jgi:hypothetical protein
MGRGIGSMRGKHENKNLGNVLMFAGEALYGGQALVAVGEARPNRN